MKEPIISIIVPVFNGAQFIVAALKSLSRQTYRNIEIIVVDDGSTDGTVSQVLAYKKHEGRLRLEMIRQRKGVHRARIHGMKKACGQYLCFLDADDMMDENAIEYLVTASVRHDADVVISGIRFISEDGIPGKYKLRFPHNRLYRTGILSHYCTWELGTGSMCNKIYRREIIIPFLKDFGETISINEDYLVNFGVFQKSKRVLALSSVLYFYRQHQSSVTYQPDRAKSFAYMLRAYAVCLETYGHMGNDVLEACDALYRKQLKFKSYTVPEPKKLSDYSEHIAATLERLMRVHPEAIYRLCHLFDANDDFQLVKPWTKRLRQFFGKSCTTFIKSWL